MTITVTTFKAKCLQLLKAVETDRNPVEITRRGKVVARVVPPGPSPMARKRPWERLRGHGRLTARPDESVLRAADFEAAR